LDKGYTAAWHDAFFDSGAGCGESIFDSVLLFLHFDLSCSPNIYYGNATSEFRKAFLEFFAVIIASRLFDLHFDLSNSILNILLFAATIDNCGIIFVDLDGLGCAKLANACILEL